MSGGITQLVVQGIQDKHLTQNPQISFFHSYYSRHTNFSQLVKQQTINGNIKNNGISTVHFERSGDLLSYVYFTIDDGTQSVFTTDWTLLIDKVELLIGGQVIDEQDSIFSERIAVDLMAQNVSKSSNGPHSGSVGTISYFYPLRFFFCENWKSCLPLISLQYHDVDIRITWSSQIENYNIKCWANYVFLDEMERLKYSESSKNMLIYQVQKTTASNEKIQELVFNNPVKYIASTGLTSTTNKINLQINGTELGEYKFTQPHHVDIPMYYNTKYVTSPTIFLYPFCLSTSELQPTGSLNFSMIDSARIISENENVTDDIYAVNYNILKIENGMGGLLYAN